MTQERPDSMQEERHDAHKQECEFTQGPTRFIRTSDGFKDCMALLVDETLAEKLSESFQKKDELKKIESLKVYITVDIETVEDAVSKAQEAIERTKHLDKGEDVMDYLKHQESRLLKLCRRKDDLENRCDEIKREMDRAMNFVTYTMEQVMRSEGPVKPIKPVSRQSSENMSKIEHPVVDPLKTSSMTIETSDQARRREAHETARDCWRDLERAQHLFDNRDNMYHQELAEYELGVKDGTVDFSRSEFDRCFLAYGQELTGALIAAEASFDAAHEDAEMLKADETDDDRSCFDFDIEEPTPIDPSAGGGTLLDRVSIESWRQTVIPGGFEELDGWSNKPHEDPGFVDISDSASAHDEDGYRKKIDQWQRKCGRYEGRNRKRACHSWNRKAVAVDRRHSF